MIVACNDKPTRAKAIDLVYSSIPIHCSILLEVEAGKVFRLTE
jgi:hypothetical protein